MVFTNILCSYFSEAQNLFTAMPEILSIRWCQGLSQPKVIKFLESQSCLTAPVSQHFKLAFGKHFSFFFCLIQLQNSALYGLTPSCSDFCNASALLLQLKPQLDSRLCKVLLTCQLVKDKTQDHIHLLSGQNLEFSQNMPNFKNQEKAASLFGFPTFTPPTLHPPHWRPGLGSSSGSPDQSWQTACPWCWSPAPLRFWAGSRNYEAS